MEDYLRHKVYCSRLQYAQEQVQYQRRQIQHRQQLALQFAHPDYERLNESIVPECGMDRRQAWGGARFSMGMFATPQAGLRPFNLIRQQRSAALLTSALDCGERAPIRLSRGVEAVGDRFRIPDSVCVDSPAKRALIAEDWEEILRKRPRGRVYSEAESAREVRLLHQLWKENKGSSQTNEKSGWEDESHNEEKGLKVTNRNRNRKQRIKKRDKVQVKIDTSGKPSDEGLQDIGSNWEGQVLDANKSWIEEEQEQEPGECKMEAWVSNGSTLQLEPQNGIEAVPLQEKAEVNQVKPEVEEDKVRQSFVHVQKYVVNALKEFLGRDSDAENSDDEMDFSHSYDRSEEEGKVVQSLDELQNPKGREVLTYDFFVNLFNENRELRKLYEEHCNCGSFECIVCAAIGIKLRKRFPDLVSLVQHAQKILRTKKRQEHRGYARAVCGLLGWDPLRDPVPVRTVGFHPRGCIPPPDEESQGNQKEENVNARSLDPQEEERSDVGNMVAEKAHKFDETKKDENCNLTVEKPYVKPSDSSIDSSIAIEAQE